MDDFDLIKLANEAKEKAYAPYSKFKVGAAILTKEGKVFTGCNIENASFGSTNCAERTALFKAVSEGYRNFSKIAIVADSEDFTYPCGICRQVIAEFGTDIEVIVANKKLEYKVHQLYDLLPYAFSKKDIERR
ncbi:cytidine deaminase [Caloramator sp. E03]|uniref:cytidine deaminase n=1 Tax=Caloramator sp. E03 TaxID=2576307 RepID=UPI001110CDFC|nr:cytidine deaminase [Caloramator sp. E03]QCX32402.1 cytidine deaminase [Caloramator sp. E03]